MALTNTLIQAGPIIDKSSHRREYVITTADLAALGAFTTGTITLENLPAGAVVLAARWKHSAAVVGASVSASTARMVFNGNNLGAGALDIFAAPGSTPATHYITDVTGNGAGKIDDVNALTMALTTTGANFSVVTAGEVHAWVEYILMG